MFLLKTPTTLNFSKTVEILHIYKIILLSLWDFFALMFHVTVQNPRWLLNASCQIKFNRPCGHYVSDGIKYF